MLYAKLALSNIRKSAKDYTVYFITLILGVCVFYLFNTLGAQSKCLSLESQKALEAVNVAMGSLTVVLSIVLGALMVYANNYLIKRRKKELGLYQVLGMNKVQVSTILFMETMIASLISFVIGICLGIFMSQFMIFLTASFFREKVIEFNFIFSVDAFKVTLKSFAIITLVMMVFNLRALKKVELIDLMKAKRVSEKFKMKSPYLIVFLFVTSIAMLIWSYLRLEEHGYEGLFGVGTITHGTDVFYNAFLQTTVLMIVGTILFFYSVAQASLRIAQASDSYYFSGLHPFSLRQMSANGSTATGSIVVICLLLFFSVTFITFGMSVAGSIEELLNKTVPYQTEFCFYNYQIQTKAAKDQVTPDFKGLIGRVEPDLVQDGKRFIQVNSYEYLGSMGSQAITLDDVYKNSQVMPPDVFKTASSESGEGFVALNLNLLKLSDYNKICKILGKTPLELKGDQYAMTCNLGSELPIYYTEVMQENSAITILGHTLYPGNPQCIDDETAVLHQAPMGLNPGTYIVPDQILAKDSCPSYVYCIYQGNTEVDVDKFEAMQDRDLGSYRLMDVSTARGNYTTAINQTAIMSYLSIYIGMVMVTACAAIISIQQLSFAVDSQSAYGVLRKLGSSEKLIHSSLCKQILMYFLAPFILALCHSYVALHVLLDDVGALWPISISASALRIGMIFVAIYVLYFIGTYLTCKNIIDKQ